ncbi:hypothetical protein EPI10_025132 [Gossypium australe]|uniref:Reverse transcriptase n=1 Tax=Gossypium australe TaxID=47621 RepID=A0A5B6W0K7_9ROSI|nr:hypothetical protein EPI10_025132 [Gossypium australe]
MSKAYNQVEWGSTTAKMERLSTLMDMALQEGLIKGATQISHLLFVNDYVLFGEANERRIQYSNDPESYLGLPNMYHGTVLVAKGTGKKGIYWCEWSRLCELKEDGGNQPSYSWKSIWVARGPLQDGFGWKRTEKGNSRQEMRTGYYRFPWKRSVMTT